MKLTAPIGKIETAIIDAMESALRETNPALRYHVMQDASVVYSANEVEPGAVYSVRAAGSDAVSQDDELDDGRIAKDAEQAAQDIVEHIAAEELEA
jgi:hypothetical protein